jgi:AAA family ATPase
MKFELSLDGPKRTFVVESFLMNGRLLPDSMARFGDSTNIKIATGNITNEPTGPRPSLQVVNIEGIDRALAQLNQFLRRFDGPAPYAGRACGVLLHGAKGTGKTMLLDKVCQTGWGPVFRVEAQSKPQVLRDLFQEARKSQPSIIVIDDIESVISHAKLLGEEMDTLTAKGCPKGQLPPQVVVLAATSTPNELPSSLKDLGRFRREIMLPVPDVDARKKILRSLANGPNHSETELLDKLGERTYAYTPRDLAWLLAEAYDISWEESMEANQRLSQVVIDQALLVVRPTAMHDITLAPPKVRWGEIGGQENIKKALRRAVETPLKVN